jgi:hypothetical protein
MPSKKHAVTFFTLVTLAACGGGGGSTGSGTPPPPTATTQSVGGIWTTQYTVTSGANTGDVIAAEGIASETGQYFAYSKNTTNGCAELLFGQLSVSGGNVSGNADAAVVRYSTVGGTTNCAYPDGSTSAKGTLAGTVAQRTSLTLTATATTSLGAALPGEAATFTFSSLYLNPSSLATIAGNYNDGGLTMTVDASGAIFEQAPNGCIVSGHVSIINSAYNAYSIQLAFANCTGTSASLNGVTASGLVTLDSTTSPMTVVGGITGSVGGQLFVEVFNLTRM